MGHGQGIFDDVVKDNELREPCLLQMGEVDTRMWWTWMTRIVRVKCFRCSHLQRLLVFGSLLKSFLLSAAMGLAFLQQSMFAIDEVGSNRMITLLLDLNWILLILFVFMY